MSGCLAYSTCPVSTAPGHRTRDPGTSRAAALLARPGAARAVWRAVRDHGPTTADRLGRILAAIRLSPESVRGRLVELRRAGLVRRLPRQRRTAHGCWAHLYVVADRGLLAQAGPAED